MVVQSREDAPVRSARHRSAPEERCSWCLSLWGPLGDTHPVRNIILMGPCNDPSETNTKVTSAKGRLCTCPTWRVALRDNPTAQATSLAALERRARASLLILLLLLLLLLIIIIMIMTIIMIIMIIIIMIINMILIIMRDRAQAGHARTAPNLMSCESQAWSTPLHSDRMYL